MAKKLHHTKLSKSVRNLSLSGSKTVHINKNDLQAPITKDDGFQVDKKSPEIMQNISHTKFFKLENRIYIGNVRLILIISKPVKTILQIRRSTPKNSTRILKTSLALRQPAFTHLPHSTRKTGNHVVLNSYQSSGKHITFKMTITVKYWIDSSSILLTFLAHSSKLSQKQNESARLRIIVGLDYSK